MFKRVMLTLVLVLSLVVQAEAEDCLKPLGLAGTDEEMFPVVTAENLFYCYSNNAALAEQLKGKYIGIQVTFTEVDKNLLGSGYKVIAQLNLLDRLTVRFKREGAYTTPEFYTSVLRLNDTSVIIGKVARKVGMILSISNSYLPYKFQDIDTKEAGVVEELRELHKQGIF